MRLKIFLMGITMISLTVFSNVGAARIENLNSFTIEEALTYSMEDELLANAEYEKIIEKYGYIRPFINIVQAEKTHIKHLEPLLEKYGVEYPELPEGVVILPDTLTEAYELGIEAEIENIAMYEKFLEKELPKDVEEVFIILKNASKNHLRAFRRQLEK